MVHGTPIFTRCNVIRAAALAAVATWGSVAAPPSASAMDTPRVPPVAAQYYDFGTSDNRSADTQRRVESARLRVDEAQADLQAVREPALTELEDSPEFHRALGDADAADEKLTEEISRVLDRLSQENRDYRRARATQVASNYVPALRASDTRAADLDDKVRSMEREALDADRRVRDARAEVTDANDAIDALLTRYEDRLRERPAIADAADRLKAAERALADATADLQGADDRFAGVQGPDEDRYTPPPRDVVDTYERDLSPSGRWVDLANYGRCFVPNNVDNDWRPYTNGRWSHGDDGWAWVADEREASWGEICYHYGRWTHDDRVGWAWVPGAVWAPAWVAWREGGDYCGWAPLPPEGGLTISASIADRIPQTYFNFCEQRYLGEPRLRERLIAPDRSRTIINNTTVINNITVVNNRVVNRGVDVARVERLSGHRVEQAQFATAGTVVEAQRLRAEGKVVRYEPPVVRKAAEDRIAQHERVVQRAATQTPSARSAATAGNRNPAGPTETPGTRTPARANESTGTIATPRASSPAADRTAERERAIERERTARTGTAAKPAEAVAPSSPANAADRRKTTTTPPAAPDAATATRTERERAAERERTATGTPSATGQPATPDRTMERSRAAKAAGSPAATTDTASRDRASTPADRDRNARPAGAVIPPDRDRIPEPARPSSSPGASSSRDRSPEPTPSTPAAADSRAAARERAAERDQSNRSSTTAPAASSDPASSSAHDRAVAREKARQSEAPGKNR